MIVGFVIDSISARRNEISVDVAQGIDVNTTPTITNVELIDTIEKKDAARFSFTFECKYVPDVGNIKLEGNLLWRGSRPEDAKEIVDNWEKKKGISQSAAVEAMNTIFRRCLSKTIMLTDDLRLPPPLQFPVVKPVPPEKRKSEERPGEIG